VTDSVCIITFFPDFFSPFLALDYVCALEKNLIAGFEKSCIYDCIINKEGFYAAKIG